MTPDGECGVSSAGDATALPLLESGTAERGRTGLCNPEGKII